MKSLHHTGVPTPPIDPVARKAKRAFAVVSASSVGLEFALSVAIGALFGRWLDTKAGTAPWLMLLFLVLGFVAGVRSLVRAIRKMDREVEKLHG